MGALKLHFYKENKRIPWDTVVEITKDRSLVNESMEVKSETRIM